MNMKTLDVEQLSSIAGAEPRGVSPTGRQNDGTDIRENWDIVVEKQPLIPYRTGYRVSVYYNDDSVDYIESNGAMKRERNNP
jgi:hypothetical protein